MKKIYLSFLLISSFFTYSQTYNLSSANNGLTISTCSGDFYDGGGVGGNYGTNYVRTITFCPSVAGSKIKVTFTSFGLENGFDYLYAYDGPTSSSPAFGGSTGSISPGIVLASNTNTSGCITFVFDSDNTGTDIGWAASISCVAPCQTVTSVFSSSTPAPVGGIIKVCPGQAVNFNGTGTFSGSGSGSTYTWDFGNGTTANGSSAAGTFATAGSYLVNLNIVTPLGCKNNNYINQVVEVATLPTLSTIPSPTSICLGQTASIAGGFVGTPFIGSCNPANAGTTFLPDGTGVAYNSSLPVNCYASGATITAANQIQNICLNMEHSFLGDLNIAIKCPNGQQVDLQTYNTSILSWSGNDLGTPNLTGTLPGTGANYCFSSSGSSLIINAPTTGGSVNPGTYLPSQSFAGLIGCPLNGNWTIVVTDNRSADNGYIFNWDINFTPASLPLITGLSFTPTLSSSNWSASPTIIGTSGSTITVQPSVVGSTCYTFNTTDNFGCNYNKTQCITAIAGPYAGVNNTLTVCANGATSNLFPLLGAGTATNGSWTGPSALAGGNLGTYNPVTLTAGNYTYTVPGSGSCPADIAVITVIENPLPAATLSFTNPSCGLNNGIVNINNTSGAGQGPFVFATSVGSLGGQTVTAVPAGAITVTITNTFSCSATTNTTLVNQPGPTAITTTFTNATCGLNNGSFTFGAPTGGTSPYTYAINGGAFSATSPTTGLAPATYSITVKDVNGCLFTKTVVITNIPGPTAIAGTTTQASCNANNGTYTVTGVTGGTATYSFAVDAAALTTSSVTTGLSAGTHTILVRDANGCTFSTTFAIGTANGPSSFTVNTTNSNCGLANGTSTVSGVVGGTPTYSFSFDGGTFATTTTASGLLAGTHTVTVKDVNSCTITATYVVSNNAPPTASVTNSVNVLCNGGSTGSFTATAVGNPSFSYTLTAPVQTNTTGVFTALPAGTYSVIVKDNFGCTTTTSVTLTQPTPVTATVSSIPVNCFGNSAGTVSAGGAGGVGPYTYLWPALGSSTLAAVGGATAGTYTVTIKDANLCTITKTVTVTQPASLTLTSTLTPATCGNANGSGTVTVAGGTPTYTYNWSNGGLTNVLTAASAGTHTVTVQDFNGCILTRTVLITNIPGPTAIAGTTTQASCNTNNGTYTVTGVTGGTATYSFAVDAAALTTSSVTTGLSAGTHTILVRDANGCTFSTTFAIGTANGPSSFTVNTTNSNCGLANGTSTVSGVVGGTPTYSFSFDGGAFATTTTSTGLLAGTHTVIVKDVNSCTITATYVVSNNAPPTASVTNSVNVLCNGGSTGSFTATAVGNPSFSYTLTAPVQTNTTGVFTALPAGTYSVIVKDNFGCTTTTSVTLTQPTPVTATVSSIPVNCFGNSTGTVSAGGSGGVAPYTYLWPALGSSTLATVGGAAAGTYTVTIKDANLCAITKTVTVTQPTSLTLTSTLTPATCGNANGSGTVTISGGTPNYSYNWSNGGLTNVLTAASAGTYTLTTQDLNGCILTSTSTITNIPGPTAITGTTTLAGCGLLNGTYNVTGVTGGTAIYTYSVDGVATGSLTSGLAAGTHTILVKDANVCTFSTTFNINTANGPTSANILTTNATCGAANGTSTVTSVTGGVSPYQYSFDGSAFAAVTATTGLSAGTHTVIIRDVNSCTLAVTYNELNNSGPTVSVTSSLNILCNGASTGSLTATPVGGIGPFTYTLTSPTQTNTTGAFTGLIAGSYNITVKDNSNCTATASVTLTQPTAVTLTVTSIPVTCFGTSTGTVSASGSGGVSPYTYLWPALASNTNSSVNNVAAGTYSVTQTDANGCAITQSVTVTQPTSLTLTSTLTPATCGNANGSGTVTVTGGTPAYIYSWSNGGITNTLSGASAGTYTLNVTDFNSCVLTKTVNVTNIPGPTAITGTTTLAGCGLSNGTHNVTGVTGGTPTYSYSVDGVSTPSLTSGLSAGTHALSVSDFNGCTFSTTFNINTANGPTSSTVVTNNANCGNANGTATVTGVTGGVAAYQYSFDGGAFAAGTTTTGLATGTHTLTVKDFNSCVLTINYNVANNPLPTASVTNSVNIKCFGGNTGSFTVTAATGISPFTYSLTTPVQTNTTGVFTTLPAGAYNVTISDNTGCTTTTSVTLTQPTAVTLTTTSLPVTCFGTSTGTVSASGSGGVGPYTYLWPALTSNTNSSVSNVAAGTYSVTQTDANGCSITQSVTVTQPTSLTLTSTLTPATCGNANGSGTVSVMGGTPAYTFSWSNGGITNTLSGALAGTYTLNVTDFNSCVLTKTLTVINIPGPTAITGTTTLAGCGLFNGTYNITGVTGGTSAYTYSVDAVATGSLTGGLGAGTHTVTVSDFNSCLFSTTFNIGTTTGPATATISSSNSSCGSSNGTSTVTGVTGGLASYQYSFDGGAFVVGASTTGLIAGTHTVTIKDANSCTLTVNYNVLNNGTPTSAIISTTSTSCFGGSNGGFTIAGAGGSGGPFTYTVASPFQNNSSGIFTGLAAGTYTTISKDNAGCTITGTVTISEPTLLTLTPSSIPAKCFGAATGTINIVGAGGTSPYQYSLNGGGYQLASSYTAVGAAIYNISIKDFNGCISTQTVQVNQPTALAILVATQNANCTAANGIATTTVTGGTPIYTYSWTGGGAAATSNSVVAGTYTVTASDNNGCVISSAAVIGLTPGGTATISASSNLTCNGSNDGSLTASMLGGAAPFTYSWSPGVQASAAATNLSPGSYTCIITDFYGCKATAIGTVIQPPVLTAIMNSNNVKCYNTLTGTVSAAGTGGTSPYTYLWTTLASSLATVPNVGVNNYPCTITDANGCSITQSIVVTQPTPINLTSSVTSANCGQPNGSATVTALGGAPGAYTFTWSAGSNTNILAGVKANTYTINVQDANNCLQTLAVTIPNIAGPVISIASQTNVSCFGGNNGVVTTNVSGGVSPYLYSWGNGSVSSIATNLSSTLYTVSATDQAGCVSSTSVSITQPTALTVNILSTNPKCFGSSNGFGIAAALGGTPSYSYSWSSTGGNAATSNQLGAGNYGLTVTDGNGCIITSSMALSNPALMLASITSTNVSCFGACNGIAAATSTNGIGAVGYYWTGGTSAISSQTATGLCIGSYTMVATDQNNCTASAQITITQPTALIANITLTGSVTCNGGSNGYTSVTPGGGTPAYTYVWSGAAANANSANANNLPAGTYSVTITDTHSCTATTSAIILEPAPLVTTLTTADPKCFGVCNGTGNVAFTGGSGALSFLWYPGLQTGNFANTLCVGNQTVEITYNSTCKTTKTFTLSQPNPLTTTVTTINSNCLQNNGQACVAVDGGTIPYQSLLWSNGVSGVCNYTVTAGAYTFTVTDFNNCQLAVSALVNDIAAPIVAVVTSTNVRCFGESNGGATATIAGGVSPYIINWSGSPITTATVTGLPATLHNITVTDNAGCIGNASVNITQPQILTGAITSFTDVTCFGLSDGGATMLLNNGGTAPYSFVWASPLSPQTSSQLSSVPAGNYTCNVTDSHGCKESKTINISQPQPLGIQSTSVTPITCFGFNNGQINVVINGGGTAPYNFQWTPTQANNGFIAPLAQGGYTLLVTDAHSCNTSTVLTVLEPLQLISSYTSLPDKCGLANGSASVSVSGGMQLLNSPFYNITWNTSTPQSGSVAVNMGNSNNYTAVITDLNGCSITQTISVAAAPSPTITGFVPTSPSCFGLSNGSIVVNYTSGTAPYSVIWSNPISQTVTTSALTQSVSGVGSGLYSATIKDSYGCVASMPVNVAITPFLALVIDSNKTICYGQTSQVSASGSGGTGAYSYTWSPNPFNGGGPHTVNPTTTTSYTVAVSDVNGCSPSPKIITISVTPSLSVLGSSITLCHGIAGILTPTISSPGNGGPYTYSWSPVAATSPSITVVGNAPTIATTNTITLIVKDGCTIPNASTIFTVNANPLPTVTFTASVLEACAPASINFTATPGVAGSYSYAWYDGDKDLMGITNPVSYNYSMPGSFGVSLVITNATTGCSATEVKTNYIIIDKQPIASFYADPTQASILDPNINFINTSQGATSYFWDFGDPVAVNGTNNSSITNPSHYYNVIGLYNVHLIAISNKGCRDTALVVVEITPDFALYIPNAFTPDGNGKNDSFAPMGVGIDEDNYRMDIFDRWGENIFNSTNFRKGWDGSVKGGSKLAPQGVYIYKLYVTDLQGGKHPYVGHVTVIRKD